MSRVSWLVLAVSILVFTGILGAAAIRDRHAFDTKKHAAATGNTDGVDLKSELSLQQHGDWLDIVASITIQNHSDKSVLYLGTPCYPPARPGFESTLEPPAGPPYPASAAALRDHVMQYRRSFDQIGYFVASTGGHVADMEPCDESGPPVLPPHKTITYSMHQSLGSAAQPEVDAATTDVVTTLKLGHLPSTWTGRFPPPIQDADTIQVRTPLRAMTDISRQSMADYYATSRHFDLVMKDPRIASWVDAQDPSLWRAARLSSTYSRSAPGWKLEAFNHAWATPLLVGGTDSALTSVTIPDEPWTAAPSTDAVVPPGSSSSEQLELPYRDLYVGDLVLPSGRVMVGDGFSSDNELLFDYGLRPGRYAIHILTAEPRYRTEDADFESVAFEELILSNNRVTHWEPAVPVGHSIKELKPGELFSFGTDGGGGGFASPEAMKVIDADLVSDGMPILTALGEREEANDWLWAMTTVDLKTGGNVFVTNTGGDGGFPILLGLDAQDRPAVLLSDFGVLGMTYSGIKL